MSIEWNFLETSLTTIAFGISFGNLRDNFFGNAYGYLFTVPSANSMRTINEISLWNFSVNSLGTLGVSLCFLWNLGFFLIRKIICNNAIFKDEIPKKNNRRKYQRNLRTNRLQIFSRICQINFEKTYRQKYQNMCQRYYLRNIL